MKNQIKILVDIAMTVVLIFLMSYELIGQTNHELLGIVMTVLFFVHHYLNRKWLGNIGRGRYDAYRKFQTALVFLMTLCIICQAVSGIILSKSLFTFLNIRFGQGIARTAHMIGSYWGFVIMSLHLGLHWNVMMKKLKVRNSFVRKLLPVLGYMIAIYGIYAFLKRGIFAYLLLFNQFVYYDYSEPLIFYLLDYMAVMGSFVYLGNLIASELKGGNKR